MEKKLLIIVDYQADFAAPDGALTAGPPALSIEDYLYARASEHLAQGQDVIFTMDTHDPETWGAHPESRSFPPHCHKGQPGWQLYGRMNDFLGKPHVSLAEKAAYCPRFVLLEQWAKAYGAIEIMGLVTDICVLHTAIGLYTAKVNGNLPVRLIVREEGCASFDQSAHQFALRHMWDTLKMRP